MNGISKKRFKILTIDLDVTVSSGYIIAIFVLQDHKAKFLHLRGNFVEVLCSCEKKILPYDSCGIFCGVVYIILRFTSFDDICIDGVNTRCQTAASFDICFFRDQHLAGFLF